MRCKICSHQDRLDIDRQIITGVAYSRIGKEFDISDQSVRNHAMNHISRQLLKSQETRDLLHSKDLMQEVQDILEMTKRLLVQAEGSGKLSAAFQGIGQWRGALEFVTNLAVKLKELELAQKALAQSEKESLKEYDLTLLSRQELEVFAQLIKKTQGRTRSMSLNTLVPDPDKLPVEKDPITMPKAEPVQYTRNRKGKPRNVPEAVEILDDRIQDLNEEYDDLNDLDDYVEPEPAPLSAFEKREQAKARQFAGLMTKDQQRKANRSKYGGNTFLDPSFPKRILGR